MYDRDFEQDNAFLAIVLNQFVVGDAPKWSLHMQPDRVILFMRHGFRRAKVFP